MFLKTKAELGTIKAGSNHKMEFPYDESVSYITKIEGCSCANAYNKAADRKIVLDYTADVIPKHLVAKGEYKISKSYKITAVSTDGSEIQQSISFEAKVVK